MKALVAEYTSTASVSMWAQTQAGVSWSLAVTAGLPLNMRGPGGQGLGLGWSLLCPQYHLPRPESGGAEGNSH